MEQPKKRGPKPSGRPIGTPIKGRPKPPAWLTAEAKRHWRELCDLVEAAGLLSLLDRDALTIYCALWSRWCRAEKELAAPKTDGTPGEGEVIKAANGYYQPSPWYTIATAAQKDMKPFLDMFGLSPRARAKLKLPEPEDDGGDKWAGVE